MNYQRPLHFALRTLLFAALLFALTPLLVAAQTATANLSGTVEDQNGAVVPGATVTVNSSSTGLSRQTTTNDAGSFTFPLLMPGSYTVRAEHVGFMVAEINNLVLNVGDQKALRIPLKTGNVSETVNITGEAPLINTSPAVATTIDRKFVGNLPLNGRSFQSLILLTPGVVLVPDIGRRDGQFSVNGQRQNANYFTVDGVSANVSVNTSVVGSSQQAGSLPGTTALGTTQSLLSVDALEEFKIQTSTYTAELGRQPGGQVQLVSRSGTNDFHGSAFEFLRNEAFDANDWFSNRSGIKKPPLRQNQFGGTFSGPVILPNFGDGGPGWYKGKDRTFFFFSYEGLRLLLPTTVNTRVPSVELRQAAPAALKPFLNMFPVPTGPQEADGVARFIGAYSSPSSHDATSLRIDHKFTDKLNVFGRYSQTASENFTRTLSLLTGSKNDVSSLTLGGTMSPSTSVSNEFRFNYTDSRGRSNASMDDFGGAIPIEASTLISGYSGPGRSFGVVQFLLPGAPLSVSLGDFVDSYNRQFNIVYNLTWVKGSHSLKFGFDYRRLAPVYGPVAYRQTLSFISAAQVRSGMPFLFIEATQGSEPLFDNYSAYAQNTWRATPRLTLDLGVRWEVNPPPGEANGIKPVLVTGIENLPTATLAPPDAPLYKTFYGAFAPRFGAAYQLLQKPGRETVLRGGFGVYYDLGNGLATSGFGRYPFFAFRDFATPVQYPLSPADAAPPTFPPAGTLPVAGSVTALNPDLKLPYTLQWNFTVEQSLGSNQAISVAYVAAVGRRLLLSQQLNERPRNPTTGASLPRPNGDFQTIFLVTTGPTSDYHSMQVQFQRRLSHGLQALANYTWSHAIDEVSTEAQTGILERGNANFDVRHNFSAAISYNIPKLHAGPVFTWLLRDWSIDAIVLAYTGLPLNLTGGSNFIRSDGTFFSVRPDVIPGQPYWIDDPIAPGGKRLNPAAFAQPPRFSNGLPTRQGTMGRNVAYGWGRHQVNMALRREFKFTEKWNLQISAEAFNVFNHPLLGTWNTSVPVNPATSTTFGRATEMLNRSLGGNRLYQLGGPRSMQFSVRLAF